MIDIEDFDFDTCVQRIEQDGIFLERSMVEGDKAFSQTNMLYAAVFNYILEDYLKTMNGEALVNNVKIFSNLANEVTEKIMAIRKMDPNILPIKSTSI